MSIAAITFDLDDQHTNMRHILGAANILGKQP